MTKRNFADPDYEPTDEDFAELMREAFAGIAEAREQSLREMHRHIAELQRKALAEFRASRAARGTGDA
jgi:hypothetical protein